MNEEVSYTKTVSEKKTDPKTGIEYVEVTVTQTMRRPADLPNHNALTFEQVKGWMNMMSTAPTQYAYVVRESASQKQHGWTSYRAHDLLPDEDNDSSKGNK
jgi:hypothetical protein